MTRIDNVLFWLFVAFGLIAFVTGLFALNIAPILVGLALVLAAMLYRHIVKGFKDLRDGLELLRGTVLAQAPSRGEDRPPTTVSLSQGAEKS